MLNERPHLTGSQQEAAATQSYWHCVSDYMTLKQPNRGIRGYLINSIVNVHRCILSLGYSECETATGRDMIEKSSNTKIQNQGKRGCLPMQRTTIARNIVLG